MPLIYTISYIQYQHDPAGNEYDSSIEPLRYRHDSPSISARYHNESDKNTIAAKHQKHDNTKTITKAEYYKRDTTAIRLTPALYHRRNTKSTMSPAYQLGQHDTLNTMLLI